MNAFAAPLGREHGLAGDEVRDEEQRELERVAAEHVAEHQRVALEAHAGDAGADLGQCQSRRRITRSE